MNKIIDHIKSEWYKYFIEIVVLIIGIYGAFTLESWGEKANRREQELTMLKNIKTSLQSDTSDLNYNLKANTRTLRSQKIVIDYLDRKIPYDDSISFHFASALSGTIFISSEGAFETLKAVGVDIVSNEELLNKILNLYDFTFDYYQKLDHQYIDVFYQAQPYYSAHFREWNFKKMEIFDQDAIRSDNSVRYYVGTLSMLNETFIITNISKSLQEAEQVIAAINEEIEILEKY